MAAINAEISSSRQTVRGTPVTSAMIWRHTPERAPPPMMRSWVIGVPVPSASSPRLRRISKQMDSSTERYRCARVCVPRQPTTAPRASASQ